nr:hypothetical protein [Tanacetum cinerariifolium]
MNAFYNILFMFLSMLLGPGLQLAGYANRVCFAHSQCDIAYWLINVDDIILITSFAELLHRIIASLPQRKYTFEILECIGVLNCHSWCTPIDTESKLGVNDPKVSDLTLYRSLVEWMNCPKSWHRQYGRGDKKYPTLLLQAVASYDLWIWHAFFEVAGDLTVLNHYPLFETLLNDTAPIASSVVNGVRFDKGYYLADRIYPQWATFVKSSTVA